MGLDNGIIIKAKTKKGNSYLERYFDWLESSNESKYEFGYWRKCWNIRGKFIDDFKYDRKNCLITFKISDIPAIINTLKYFLKKENWEYNGKTSLVFNWYEELPSIANAIRDLYLFYDYIDEGADNEDDVTDEDFEIYFYDSY
jgi:hypothetical protein